jgi:tetracycline resistance efflux pump
MEYGVISLLIPLLTILLAIITKDVVISLLGGLFASLLVIHGYNPLTAFTALFDGVVVLLEEGWISKTLLFALMIGAVMHLLSDSGAIDQFVAWLTQTSTTIDSPRGAMMLAYLLGVVIFIESSITALVSGTVARPLCDKHGVSREKLAYICDSTSAPICSLIPLNAWGALLLGLILTAIESQIITGDALSILIASIPYNFYALFTLLLLLLVIGRNLDIGVMKHATPHPYTTPTNDSNIIPSPYPMLLPLVVMILSVPMGLYLTGDGDIFAGSGSTSLYYSMIITLLVIYIYYRVTKKISHKTYFKSFYQGVGEMIPITLILLLALYIGKIIGDLGTASYLAQLLQGNISPLFIPLLIFLTASLTSFATGTSWGTFSIMMPIALTLGASFEIPPALLVASVISGGIFGDHASPISDTTIVSSMASGCDPIAHVRTQLPYALIAGGLSAIAFVVSGWIII